MTDSHYHFTINAYEKADKKSNLLLGSVDMQVLASDEKEALSKAKKMIKRPKYFTRAVFECFKDHEIEQEMQMVQLELQSQMLKMHK